MFILNYIDQGVEIGYCEDYTAVQARRTIAKQKFFEKHGLRMQFPRRFHSPPKKVYTIKQAQRDDDRKKETRWQELVKKHV